MRYAYYSLESGQVQIEFGLYSYQHHLAVRVLEPFRERCRRGTSPDDVNLTLAC